MTIETCARCGRPRDDADEEAFDDEWMPLLGPSGQRENLACPACVTPDDQAALEQWVDDFDKEASRRSALGAAVSTPDERQFALEYHAHDVFGRAFMGADLNRLTVSELDRWISAWDKYDRLVRRPAGDPARRAAALELSGLVLSLEQAGVVVEGAAYALAFAYGIASRDL